MIHQFSRDQENVGANMTDIEVPYSIDSHARFSVILVLSMSA